MTPASRRVTTVFWVAWSAVLVTMLIPPVDLYFDGSMARHMVTQTVIYLLLGWAAGARTKGDFQPVDPAGLTGLAFLFGCLVFWMLPRSLDATLASELMDKAMHSSVLFAGFVVRKSVPRVPTIIRTLYGLFWVSMLGALGVFYYSYESRACTSYSLDDQREAGFLVLVVCSTLFAVVFVQWMRGLLSRGPRPGASEDAGWGGHGT